MIGRDDRNAKDFWGKGNVPNGYAIL